MLMLTVTCLFAAFPVDTSLTPSRGHSGEALILPIERKNILTKPEGQGKRIQVNFTQMQ